MLTTPFVQMKGDGLHTKGFSLSGRKYDVLVVENLRHDNVFVDSS